MSIQESVRDLFQRAYEKDEFNFICTLINYKGMGDISSSSNLYEWFKSIEHYESIYISEAEPHKKVRIGLLIYSIFFESSDFYNILGSLARNVLGYRGSSYLYWKHDNSERWLGTGEKVSLVVEVLSDADSKGIVDFFENTHFKNIRNTFFHSSYSLDGDFYHFLDADPLKFDGIATYKLSIDEFLIPRINLVLEFFRSFKDSYFHFFTSYTSNKVIIGSFPEPSEVLILGSPNGLIGFSTQGSYVKVENGFSSAMNIRFEHTSETRRFIADEIKRFITKDTIRTNDGSLQHLFEVISERNLTDEKKALADIYQRFGDIKYPDIGKEENHFKQRDLIKRVFSFYEKMFILDQDREVTNNIAVLKYLVSNETGDKNLKRGALNDFINCIHRDENESSIKNAVRVVSQLNDQGENIETEKLKLIHILETIENPKLTDSINESLEELKNIRSRRVY